MKQSNRIPALTANPALKQVKEIHKSLVIGGGDLDLYLEARVNGKLVVSKKADSLLGNYLKVLHLQMSGRNYVSMPAIDVANKNGDFSIDTPCNITSIASQGGGTVCRLTLSDYRVPSTPTTGTVSIQGAAGTSLLADGLYTYTYFAGNQIDITCTYQAGYTANSASARIIVNIAAPDRYPSVQSFKTPLIVVGTGTTAVALTDACLVKEMQSAATAGRLTYGTQTISQDTNDSTSSQITFTRTFTNNSGASITLHEIGMYCCYGSAGPNSPNAPYQVLIMRDLSDITVGIGGVLTINYRIKSMLLTGTNPGGFIVNFTRLMYRHFAQLARVAIDINNQNRTTSPSPSTMKVPNTGGEANCVTYGGVGKDGAYVYPAWRQGIVIGTGTTPTSEGDYGLATIVAHGAGSGQMLYYGGFVQNFSIAGGAISFDIVKTIENNSGGSITVNEIGLNVGGDNGNSDTANYEYPLYFFLAARNVLTTGVTVANGEILKVTYTIQVVL
jgi:hypothetical protein